MNANNHWLMYPVQISRGMNLLWLWILPPVFSWLFISAMEPAGSKSLWAKLAIIFACSLICGFGLASRSFKTFRQRLLGGLFFSGSSLGLIFSVAFLGCLPIPRASLSPAQLAAQRSRQEAKLKISVASHITPRDALADDTMLDLSPFFDASLNLSNDPSIRHLAPGTHTWNGIKFDIRAEIQLGWQNPQGVTGIPVGRKCSELYFLHGVRWRQPNQTVSKFVIHFAGTNVQTIPMVYGRDLTSELLVNKRDWTAAPTNMFVWQESISTNAPPQPLRAFFVSRWVNPFPSMNVETIDFVPGEQNVSAFLVAITLKPLERENK
jgi:hypothetical protein